LSCFFRPYRQPMRVCGTVFSNAILTFVE